MELLYDKPVSNWPVLTATLPDSVSSKMHHEVTRLVT